MSFAVLVSAYSHKMGLLFHLAHQCVALGKLARDQGVRVHVAAPAQEQTPGLWSLIRRNYAEDRVFVLENETTALARVTENLLKHEPRLVAHVLGSQQLRAIIPLKRRWPDRFKIVYTVRAFRNATWKRIPCSWYVARLLRRYVDYTSFYTPISVKEFVNGAEVIREGRGGILIQGLEDYEQHYGEQLAEELLPPYLMELLARPDVFRFLYLANFHTYDGKGHGWLVEAMAPVLRRHRHAYAIMAGRGAPQVMERWRRRVRELDVERQIIFPGFVDRRLVPWIVSKCQAGLIASRSETFGQTVVEPMKGNKPVISTRKGVAQWLVMDYFTGIGVDYGDRKALARAVEYFVTHPADVARMGENAGRLARNLFTWENVTASHLRIYQSLWPASRSPARERVSGSG